MAIKDVFNAVRQKLQNVIDNMRSDVVPVELVQPQPVEHKTEQDEAPWYWFFSSSLGTVWMQCNGKEHIDDGFPWKLHVFASSIDDYWRIAQPISEALYSLGLTFKTIDFKYNDSYLHAILDPVDPDGQPNPQYGKAFTIYFNRAEDMYETAKYIDTFCLVNNLGREDNCSTLEPDKHNLGTERGFGDTGRVFYRAERDSNGKYVPANEARRLNPQQPHNPYNLPDPIEAGKQRDKQDFAFVLAHIRDLDVEKWTFYIEDGYEDQVLSVLQRHMPILLFDKAEDGRIEAQSGADWVYTKAFYNGLRDYMSYEKAMKRMAAIRDKKNSQKA